MAVKPVLVRGEWVLQPPYTLEDIQDWVTEGDRVQHDHPVVVEPQSGLICGWTDQAFFHADDPLYPAPRSDRDEPAIRVLLHGEGYNWFVVNHTPILLCADRLQDIDCGPDEGC